jgi:carbonic anhydrase
MALYDEILSANRRYAAVFNGGALQMPPRRKLAVLACMDARLDVQDALGLETGDAHVIRNAGGIATEDALRSLIISHTLLGTREFLVINHTDCGMQTFEDGELRERLRGETGSDPGELRFHSFRDLEDNLRRQVQVIRETPFIPRDIPIRGLIFDVKSGKLAEVVAALPGADP